jgi:uncharacterized protein YkwD
MRSASITFLLAGMLTLHAGWAAAAPSQTDTTLVTRVLDLTNIERKKAGLGPLALSSELNDAAQKYSQVLALTGCFEHTCGAVPNFAERVGQSGYTGWTALAENIAAGYPTPEAVVAGWMNSPGHRANILSPKYTELGIGLVSGIGTMGTYWTEDFGTRPGAVVSVDEAPQMAFAALDESTADTTGDDDNSGS